MPSAPEGESKTGGTAETARPDLAGLHLIDLEMLQERIGGGADLFEKLNALFQRDAARLLGALRNSVDARTPPGHAEAHTLKGMLRNICAERGGEMAALLEEELAQGSWERAGMLVRELEQEVVLIAAQLAPAEK